MFGLALYSALASVVLVAVLIVLADKHMDNETANRLLREKRSENASLRVDLVNKDFEIERLEEKIICLRTANLMERENRESASSKFSHEEEELIKRAVRKELANCHPDRAGSTESVEDFLKYKDLFEKIRRR